MSGISFICFTASYAIAWAMELTRLRFKSVIRSAMLLVVASAGMLAHTLYLWHRLSTQPPSSTDWYLVAAWLVAGCYLYAEVFFPKLPLGVVLLPFVLGLVALARLMLGEVPLPLDETSRAWGLVHGVLLLAGTVAVILGFIAGLLYLVQDYRLKHHLPAWERFPLPSLERLERTAASLLGFALVMLSSGFLAGLALNLVNHRRGVDQLAWHDPVVWSSALLVLWMLAQVIFNGVYRPARRGRKLAYLTIGCFIFLTIVLVMQVLLPSKHGSSTRAAQAWQQRTFTGHDALGAVPSAGQMLREAAQ